MFAKLKLYLFNNQPDAESKKQSAALKIQRWYRKYKYIRNISKDSDSNLDENLSPLIPTQSRALDKYALLSWIKAHPPQLQNVATSFAKNITYRSWKKTERRLQDSVASFNETIMSYPCEARSYVIILPITDSNEIKSNHFITSVALKYLEEEPEKIISLNEISSYPHIKNFLYIDDASYSGKQLERNLNLAQYYGLNGDVNIHIVIPFCSKNLTHWIKSIFPNVIFHRHEIMLTMENLCNLRFFKPEEYAAIEKHAQDDFNDYYSGSCDRRTLYYFDHKIADSVSTFNHTFAYGRLLDNSSGVQFIQETDFSYKDSNNAHIYKK